jgi:hypothetical protein
MVTMSQKSSVPQTSKSVSQALIPDMLYLDGELFARRSCYRLVYASQQQSELEPVV